MSRACALVLLALLLGARLSAQAPALPQLGSVLFHDKISSTAGGFAGPLQDADLFGISVVALGDLDADGHLDLAAGAYEDDDGGPSRGATWLLFLDGAGGVAQSRKISSLAGGLTGPLDDNDLFGWSLAPLGDFDGDGVADLAVGGWLDDDGSDLPYFDVGAIYLLFLNADGSVKSEVKISATQGGFTGTLDQGDRFGTSLALLPDLDGDGVPELAAGALYDDDGGTNAGALYVLFLGRDGRVKSSTKISPTTGGLGPLAENARFGYAAACLGDLDADGRPELAVGALLDDDGGPGRGSVRIVSLDADGSAFAVRKISSTEGGFVGPLDDFDTFGRSVAALGDLDGDGVPDMAVGAGGDDDGGEDVGALWLLFLHADGSVKAQRKISATQGGFDGALDEFDVFGQSVAPLGDLDGDGVLDLAVGALLDDDGGPERGALWLLHLSDGIWGNLLHGLPGAAGAPRLRGAGLPAAGQTVTLVLDQAPPSAPTSLVVSAAAWMAPFHGGVLVPALAPPSLLVLLLTGPDGALQLPATWPAGVPPGTALYLQAWFKEAGPAASWSASNGLSVLAQ